MQNHKINTHRDKYVCILIAQRDNDLKKLDFSSGPFDGLIAMDSEF